MGWILLMPKGDEKKFLVRYRYDGAEWGFRLPARDLDDAKARLSQLAFARIDGELVMTLPASTGPLTGLIVACRNVAHWLRGRST